METQPKSNPHPVTFVVFGPIIFATVGGIEGGFGTRPENGFQGRVFPTTDHWSAQGRGTPDAARLSYAAAIPSCSGVITHSLEPIPGSGLHGSGEACSFRVRHFLP